MKEFESIRQWARARDLIEGSTPAHQLCKLIEEIGELAEGISKKRLDAVADGIGDAAVVLTILAAQHGMEIEQCIDLAWEQIRWRRGRMMDGIFVKETDLTEGASID
jgi:NTP pyrophosphatase (non-canonical NTP hydrolase)